MKNIYDKCIEIAVLGIISIMVLFLWSITGLLLWTPRANADITIYHGAEGFQAHTSLKSATNDNCINMHSLGLHPFLGVRLNKYISIEGGYIHNRASSEFAAMTPTFRTVNYPPIPVLPPGVTSVTPLSVQLVSVTQGRHKVDYKIHGPIFSLVFHTDKFSFIPIKLYGSIGMFLSRVQLGFTKSVPEMESSLAPDIPSVRQSAVFSRLSAGFIYYLREDIGIRAGFSLFRPDRLNFSKLQHSIGRELRHFGHLGIGMHWEWQ